ncbi:dynein axonemal intermediate chain 3-like isoform X4 [Haliotis rufescens]|uniref:dynein axonemal intermediate chain 3-like isoform X4 n=1 Tax=Haliotis rufescens TaxID=6454 RepID=UPI00201F6466|nr:dynein axonemal intermediate chain 3-like isoform X4 [Haliotis rufescens]
MSDTDGKETDKEKLSAGQTEKDEDTSSKKPATPSSVKSKSPTPSGPGSARTGSKAESKPGSGVVKNAKSPQSSAKSKTAPKANAKGKGKPKSEDKREDTPAASTTADDTEEDGIPDGVVPLFMASKTQEIFHCVCDEDVTKEEPFKIIPKQDIIEDMKMRAAISDFSVLKQQILDYPGEELLVVYDYDFKYEQNFYVALTEEAKEKLLHPPVKGREGGGEEGEEEEEEEEVVYTYVPPEAKEWVSQGSEKEIQEETVVDTRRRVKVCIRRKRLDFGAPCTFEDRNVSDAKDGYVECTTYEDKTYDLKMLELDKGTQAIPLISDAGTQTDWKYPRNANTQYYPREYSEQEREKIASSKPVKDFVGTVAPRFELALQQNEIMNVFFNDWLNLGDSDSFGNKADNHLKEYQSFTDLQFSKEKRITSIQWHPSIKGVVAVAVAERLTFDERIDNAAKVIMTPSLILIWSFTDPIHPQLLLEAPDDIYSFQFNPVDPNIIVGGCCNGQVVLWDISAHADRLKAPRGGHRKKEKNVLPGFEDPNALKTPIVRYCAVSSIEQSHKAAITDIQWVPDHMEVNRMGIPQENRSLNCIQIMSCATDHCVMFWDTRPSKGQQGKDDDKGPKNPMGIANTFRHLDLQWKPHLRVNLHKSEPGGDHSATKFTIQERQGDRSAHNIFEEKPEDIAKATDSVDKDQSQSGGFSFGSNKPGSGKEKKTLQSVNTHFYVGTEDGEVVYVDWMPQKDQDTGKIQTPKPVYYHSIHDGPVRALERSPFIKEVVLCVGGWTFSLWKENVSSGPILFSAASNVKLSAGHWSPSRPGVFFIAKVDGSVDVWDLLDKTHEPSITQSVSPSPITTLYPFQVTQKQQLLAVGDDAGTLHILEIPWSLRQPTSNEMNGVSNYFEREVKRRGFVVQRWDFRETEKRELEAEIKRKAGIAPNVVLTEEELEYKAKMEYIEYEKEEANFLRELGLKAEEEEVLPEV